MRNPLELSLREKLSAASGAESTSNTDEAKHGHFRRQQILKMLQT